MTQDDIRAWAKSGNLSKEQMAAFWTWFYCQEYRTLPLMKELCAGVRRDYGIRLSWPTASRGRELALRLMMDRCFSENGTIPQSFPFS